MLSEKERRESLAGLECQTTITSDARATILRTRVYRGCWTPALDEVLTRCYRRCEIVGERSVRKCSYRGVRKGRPWAVRSRRRRFFNRMRKKIP